MSIEWFGGRLRELREQKAWTRKQLAEASGLSSSGLRDLELGLRKPAWETVLALSKALGVDCTAFTQEPAEREPAGPGRPRKAPGVEEPDQVDDKAKGKSPARKKET
jgi:transcriptional regulator with XRE-family HTH domain